MKKTTKKIICIFILVIFSFITFVPYTYAGIWSDAVAFLTKGKSQSVVDTSKVESEVNKQVGSVSGILMALGILLAIVATLILGIKFMTASSSENKAEIKKKAIVVAVGVFVLFASGSIWAIVVGGLSRNS